MKTSYIAVCRTCGAECEIKVRDKDMIAFKKGRYVQDAFPYLSADDRELLVTGTCGKCFDKMFGDK